MPTRDLTLSERNAIREKNIFSKYFLAVHVPQPVFTCTLSSLPTSNDKVVQLGYDGVLLGNYTDVIVGMVLYVGTDPGSHDIGKLRIRKSITSNTIYCGEHSDIDWVSLVGTIYLTVVDSFEIQARHPRLLSDATFYMDYDVEYSDQHVNFLPVVNMGSHACAFIENGNAVIPFDASESWCLKSGTKTYLWACASGSISSPTSSTTNITFDTPGVYRVSCSVTVGGITRTSYRYAFVFNEENMPIEDFIISSLSGGFDNGGWDCDISIKTEQADTSYIEEGAMVVLFSKDYYNNEQILIGAQTGRENIVFSGYITTEKISVNPIEGELTINVSSPSKILSKIVGFTVGIESTYKNPDGFYQIKQMTVDSAVWHILEWRTTFLNICDYYRTEDTRQVKEVSFGEGAILEQINIALEAILAKACCDRYGRFFTEIEQQLVPVSDRSSFPVISLESEDLQEAIKFNYIIKNPYSTVNLSGVFFEEGKEPIALFSISPGNVFKEEGDIVQVERIAITDSQDETNMLAGLILGWYNHRFEFELSLASAVRMIDVCPRQRIEITISTDEDPRGRGYSGNVIPRNITYRFSENSMDNISIEGECETFPENAVTELYPTEDNEDPDHSYPPLPPFPPLPPLPPIPPIPSSYNDIPPKEFIVPTSVGVYYTKNGDETNEEDIRFYLMNEGLDVYDISEIGNVIVTPSGAIYMLTNGSYANGFEYVYRAETLGAKWQRVLSATIYTEGLSPKICGIGFNPNHPDMVAAVVGSTYISFGTLDTHRIYIANGGSFSQGDYVRHKYAGKYTSVVCRSGIWYVFGSRPVGIGGSLASARFWAYTISGGILTSTDGVEWGGGAGAGAGSTFAHGSEVIINFGNGVAGYNLIIDYLGAEQVWVEDSVDPEETPEIGVYGGGFSPDGTTGILASESFTCQRTIDTTETWEEITLNLPSNVFAFDNCKDNNRWLFANTTTIGLTLDQGDTYIERNGNLFELSPSAIIKGIRYYNG